MNRVTGSDLGNKLCELLGLDSRKILSISIKCQAGELAKVEVETELYDSDTNKLVDALKVYELKEVIHESPLRQDEEEGQRQIPLLSETRGSGLTTDPQHPGLKRGAPDNSPVPQNSVYLVMS
jgi:hypothetical protein